MGSGYSYGLDSINGYVGDSEMDLNSLLKLLLGNIKYCMAFSEYVYLTNGIFRSATERIAKYFITDLTYKNLDNKREEEIREILEKNIDIRTVAGQTIIDLLVYGNSISFVYLPFVRQLTCSSCGVSYNIEKIEYSLSDGVFEAQCPKCKRRGIFKRTEENLKDSKKIFIQNLDPKLIDIDYDPISGQTEYYYQLDTDYKNKIIDGDPHIISKIPWIFYEAAQKDKTIKFAPNQLFHMKIPSISGMFQGWGPPQAVTLSNYLVRAHYYSKASLAILKDFIVPKRILYPGGSGVDDMGILGVVDGSEFAGHMKSMQEEHRKDPTKMMVSGTPVGYQQLGGDGKALGLSEEEKFNNEQQLAAAGYPAELYYMNMNIQALPTSLRLFESFWSHIPLNLNKWLSWIIKKISAFLQVDIPDIEWDDIRLSDDIQRRTVLLQLAASQQISLATALESYGIDMKEELKKLLSQSTMQQEVVDEAAEEEEIKTQLTDDGGGNGGGGGEGDFDPNAVMAQAQQIAQEWVSLEELPRHEQMKQLREQNPLLHSVTMGYYDEMVASIRNQSGSEGLAEMRGQGPPVQ